MKRFLSFILAVIFVFSISTPVSAAMIDMNVPDTSTYSFSNPDGTTFRIETTNQLGNINVKVYINDIFHKNQRILS